MVDDFHMCLPVRTTGWGRVFCLGTLICRNFYLSPTNTLMSLVHVPKCGNPTILLKTGTAKVAFTLGQNTPRKMVVFLMKKRFFINQIAKSTANYAA